MTEPLSPVRALVIPSDALFAPTPPLDVLTLNRQKPDDHLPVIQDLVAGPLRELNGPAGGWFYYNANGHQLGLRENIIATQLAHEAGTLSLAHTLTGQVVVVGEPGTDDVDVSVPELFLEKLRGLGCHIKWRQ